MLQATGQTCVRHDILRRLSAQLGPKQIFSQAIHGLQRQPEEPVHSPGNASNDQSLQLADRLISCCLRRTAKDVG